MTDKIHPSNFEPRHANADSATAGAQSGRQGLDPRNAGTNEGFAAAQNGKLRIDIRRLTLPDFNPSEQGRFTRTLRAELEKLAPESYGVASSMNNTSINELNVGELRGGASPEEAARRIARALIDRLGGHNGVVSDV